MDNNYEKYNNKLLINPNTGDIIYLANIGIIKSSEVVDDTIIYTHNYVYYEQGSVKIHPGPYNYHFKTIKAKYIPLTETNLILYGPPELQNSALVDLEREFLVALRLII